MWGRDTNMMRVNGLGFCLTCPLNGGSSGPVSPYIGAVAGFGANYAVDNAIDDSWKDSRIRSGLISGTVSIVNGINPVFS